MLHTPRTDCRLLLDDRNAFWHAAPQVRDWPLLGVRHGQASESLFALRLGPDAVGPPSTSCAPPRAVIFCSTRPGARRLRSARDSRARGSPHSPRSAFLAWRTSLECRVHGHSPCGCPLLLMPSLTPRQVEEATRPYLHGDPSGVRRGHRLLHEGQRKRACRPGESGARGRGGRAAVSRATPSLWLGEMMTQ